MHDETTSASNVLLDLLSPQEHLIVLENLTNMLILQDIAMVPPSHQSPHEESLTGRYCFITKQYGSTLYLSEFTVHYSNTHVTSFALEPPSLLQC